MVPDPLAEKYPAWSPYNYVMNNPLGMVDPDGMDAEFLRESTQRFWSRSGVQLSDRWNANEYFAANTGERLGANSSYPTEIRLISKNDYNQNKLNNAISFGGILATNDPNYTGRIRKAADGLNYIDAVIAFEIYKYYYNTYIQGRERIVYGGFRNEHATAFTDSKADRPMQFVLMMGPEAPQSNVFDVLATLIHEFRHHYQIIHRLPMSYYEAELDARIAVVNSWVWDRTTNSYKDELKGTYESYRSMMNSKSFEINPNYNKYLPWEQFIRNKNRNKK